MGFTAQFRQHGITAAALSTSKVKQSKVHLNLRNWLKFGAQRNGSSTRHWKKPKTYHCRTVKLREESLPAVARTHRGTRSRRRAAARGGGDTAAAARSIHQHLVTKVPTSVEIMSTLWEHVSTVWCVVRCDPMSRTQTVTLLSAARWHPRNLRQGCAPAAPAPLLNVERVEVRSLGDMYDFNARSAYRIEIIYRNKITV